MANSYVTNPIVIDTTFTNGFRANATTLFAAGNPMGLGVSKVIWRTPGASASFSIQETSDSLVLLAGNTPAGYIGQDPQYDFEAMNIVWRNFKVPTLSAGVLYIYVRSLQ
jgi:hypothetical protein